MAMPHRTLRLPPCLVDLVLARTSVQGVRRAHSAAVLRPRVRTEQGYALYGSAKSVNAVRASAERVPERVPELPEHMPQLPAHFAEHLPELPGHLNELEARVLELKGGTPEEIPETYSETDLRELYTDLLALPSDPPSIQTSEQKEIEQEDAREIIAETANRLALDESLPPRLALLERLEALGRTLEAEEASARPRLVVGQEVEGMPQTAGESVVCVPTGLVTRREWGALVRLCVEEGDCEAAERVLGVMKRLKETVQEEELSVVLAAYASEGDVVRADAFVGKFLEGATTEHQRDLHIKTHLKSTTKLSFPTSALRLLHSYEEHGLLPPQKTYTRCITHLLNARSSVAHAHAWDLFAHMRYAAHPTPDPFLYSTMIRACASSALGSGGAPERALDLFAELAAAHPAAPPPANAYAAAVLACARSGRREYVGEAFRLAKEMLDAHRDAAGRPLYTPDARLFCALLEGAKRVGDLARVRWILAEMVRESVGEEGVRRDRAIGEEAMVHVLHAYAAYKPPFKRGMAAVVEGESPESAAERSEKAEEAQQGATDVAPSDDTDAAFTRLPPQSHAEVVHEARALFTRIRADVQAASGIFAHVALTPRLVDAYLSVHHAHAPLEDARALHASLHRELGLVPTAHTHVNALERAARARKEERAPAARWAGEVWGAWTPLEERWRATRAGDEGVDARMVERAYAAMVRVHALTMNLDGALELVRTFVALYPPPAVRTPAAPPPSDVRSARTRLLGPHPLVRLFRRTEVPDDGVPPLLAFAELEVLHHRLLFRGRARDVGYVKWVCKAYEGALRRRREAVLGIKQGEEVPRVEA